MTAWQKFGQKEELSESAFAKAVEGGSKMGAGTHKGVAVAGISPVDSDDYQAIDVIWENEDGQTFQQRIFLTANVWEDGEQTDRVSYSKAYIQFGHSLSGDLVLSRDFFTGIVPYNPGLLAATVGCRANITIGLPKKGFTIKNIGDDKLVVVDIETDEVQEDIMDDAGQHYTDFKEITDAAKENNLKIAFNRCLATKVNKEYMADNQAQLKLAMEDAKAPAVKEVSNAF